MLIEVTCPMHIFKPDSKDPLVAECMPKTILSTDLQRGASDSHCLLNNRY